MKCTALGPIALLAATLAGCAAPRCPESLDLSAGERPIEALATVLAATGLYTHILDDTSLVLARVRDTDRNVVVFIEDDGESLEALLTDPWHLARADTARITAWNATHRFGRAYPDEEGHPVLAADLILDPATTANAVTDWAALVLDLADAFATEFRAVSDR